MAFITLAGTLRDPTSELAVGDQIRFTHKSTTGETVEGAVSILTIDPSGTYSKDLQYGLVLVEYKDVRTSQFKNLGVATVNGSNPATSIPELLNALVPVSSAELIEFQAILADAVTARNEAEAFAASIDLINDLSQAYIFDTVAEYKASAIAFPVGKTVHLNDRDADFKVIVGTGTGNNKNVIASAAVSQSIVIVDFKMLDFRSYSDNTDFGEVLNDAFSATRSVKIGNSQTISYDVQTPVKLQSFTNILGGGVAGIFGTDVFYGGLTKSANTSTIITNPERPDQTVDTLIYPDGEYEDSNFPQSFRIEDLTARCTSPTKVGSNFYYILQGSSTTMKNVNILDFEFAFNSYECWSSYFEKVKTNGKFNFNRGTSIVMNQCSSGGQSTDGTIHGGFNFNEIRYSQLLSCSSDNTPDTAYTFTNCFQFPMNACGSEFTRGDDDDTGDCIAFKLGNQISVNNYYGVVRQHATRAAFSVNNDKVIFNQGKMVNVDGSGVPTFDNFDLVVAGNGGYVEFNQFQFSNGTYDTPKIRFNSGVTNTIVVVHGQTSNRLPKVYYSDGTGATLSRNGVIEAGTTATGEYAKFDDGTLMNWFTLPKTDFLIGSSALTSAQGINWYRSSVKNWLYPKPFVNSASAKVTITPRTGSSGTRLAWVRYSDTGETNAQTGQIQLIGVEDWIVSGQAYLNLIDVQVTAVGRWS